MGPPPAAGPPPATASPATPEQKTVFGQPAPNLPAAPAAGAANRTQAIDASGGGISSTVFMPGGQAGGMSLSPAALAARQQAMAPKRNAKAAPPKPLFWVGWALLGVSLGMLLHVLFT